MSDKSSASASASARRLAALSRQLQPAPCAASTRAQTVAELAAERARSSFSPRAMAAFLFGGERQTELRLEAMQLLESHAEFRNDAGVFDRSLAQRREHTLQRVRRLYALFMEHGADVDKRETLADVVGVFDLSLWTRNGVHFGLFLGAIMGQGSQEQQDEWMLPTMMLQLFGCYGMTELGHGSFTRGFETTATFDEETDEFVIHTPTDRATKWWIGGAGQTATHTVCFARLVLPKDGGADHGVQSFIVPLRDVETHEPLPGVTIGDMGSKMGLQGVDNGWIQFDHVRIPRANMLRRYAQVSRDGVFSQTQHKAQLAYAALLVNRGKIVTLSVGILEKAVTIAVRYAAVRRQGLQVNSEDPHAETRLLDYQTHQYRLMPVLARAYAYRLQTRYITRLLQQFDTQGSDISEALLADIHGTMSGFKAFCTWDVQEGIDACRQSCGGNGYSKYTGLAELLADFSVMVTFEGDNTVMAQQTAHYLIRSVEKLRRGEKLAGSVQYLEREQASDRRRQWGVEGPADLNNSTLLRDALDVYTGRQVLQAAAKLSAAPGNTDAERTNSCQVDLVEIARVHVFYNVATAFIQHIEELKIEVSEDNAALVPALEALCQLYICQELDRGAAVLLKEKFMSSIQSNLVRARLMESCARVRADAVALVDAFMFTDTVLNSSVGRADGSIYEGALDAVRHRTGPTPYFASAIKPIFEGETLD
ncbi:Acyl-coenzyme A oxidase 2 [Phytophthora fragariae]|uniref:Acyl-coenzyme A oxidase n=1 Tax=Phytophthora fragariae TaxID=53985 RepID=A0A6A3FZ43_9STRA|nr:Acyl-coenzyme A oxidase 2 [Phytophthora fragariae]KAE8946968.1 Acyl-coenzyme A oxidase 2 [Phytophthora fragariae]KAE9022704.1 Acyl-coenzyme A oxidase 2 [Phytophthora fragariae]KAE9133329.1 Acyl-coenzyme A oxidase 2 [Phytophthora fragariae]KAE9133900.1 Acyl-coenzyme A oxidase 2 [Phytophthora fragariae]